MFFDIVCSNMLERTLQRVFPFDLFGRKSTVQSEKDQQQRQSLREAIDNRLRVICQRGFNESMRQYASRMTTIYRDPLQQSYLYSVSQTYEASKLMLAGVTPEYVQAMQETIRAMLGHADKYQQHKARLDYNSLYSSQFKPTENETYAVRKILDSSWYDLYELVEQKAPPSRLERPVRYLLSERALSFYDIHPVVGEHMWAEA